MVGEVLRAPISTRLLGRLPTILAIAAILFGWIALNLAGIYFRDALAYWRPDFGDLYGGRQVGVMSTYLYSPAFAQFMGPFGLLPWPVFAALWSGVNLAALVWMVGPVPAALLFFLPFSPVVDEISTGNIHILFAAAIVLGFRWPATWALMLLTKITPGVGLLWFVGARRWRPIAIALGATLGIAAVSFVTVPDAWFEWLETLRRSSQVPVTSEVAVIPGPLWLRATAAALVAAVGGALGMRWLVPVAAAVALPVPWSSGMSLLVGSLALTRDRWEGWFADRWISLRGAR